MDDLEQHAEGREAPGSLRVVDVSFPWRRQRRIWMGIATVVVVVVVAVWSVLFVSLDNRVRTLDTQTKAQTAQIHHLQSQLAILGASLSAAVACLQTVGASQGICSKLVKPK